MVDTMTHNWWIPLVRGIMAIIFGILAILFPGEAFAALIYIFGIYAVVDGTVTLYHAMTQARNDRWWQLFEGIAALLAGVAAFLWTGLTGLTIVYLIGIWAIVTGVMQMVAAWRLRQEIDNEIWLGLAGLLSVIMGALFVFNPVVGAITTTWLIGTYSIAFGILFIMLAFRLREMDDTPTSTSTHAHV